MKNLKKENVYVVVDTPKKSKKLKKVLNMFGEEIYSQPDHNNNDHNGKDAFWRYGCSCGKWQAFSTNFIGHNGKKFTEVSIKELRNILAVEHLKAGDVVIAGIGKTRYVVKFEKTIDNDAFLESSKYICIDDDGFTHNVQNSGNFIKFIRYATEEEKALLEPKKELEIGKWYISVSNNIIYYGGENNIYGLSRSQGNWVTKVEDMFNNFQTFVDAFNENLWWEAIPQEVEEALIEEAKRRGYKYGDKIKSLCMGTSTIGRGECIYRPDTNILAISGNWVFKGGQWADVIEQAEVEPKPSLNIGDVVKLNNSQVAVVKDSKEAFKWRFCTKLSKEEVVELLFGKEEVELIAGNWYEITNIENTLLQYNPNGGAKGWWRGDYDTDWYFSKGGDVAKYAIPASDEILTEFGVKV